MSRPRPFLLLQGPCSPLVAERARALLNDGHGTHLIDVCGEAVLYHAGLTHRADGDSSRLDAFWAEPLPSERRLFHDLCTNFLHTLLHTVQINEGCYCRRGRRLAVEQCVQRLSADALPLEKLLTWLPRAA
ncbi:hypothetical protein ACUN9Y_14975 [Halomonas sp. V046]|uniref:hypothetical protein n=1 Tax=Halomonas sp. V046 TaxID=3459611 RepID=UPI0040448936